MKFQTYTEQVPIDARSATPNRRVPSMPAGFDAGAAENAFSKGIDIVSGVIQKQAEEDDKRTLMQFMNDLDGKRYNMMYGDGGYMTKQLDGAKGISEDYSQNVVKLRDDTLKNYNFHSRTYKLAAIDLADKSNRQGLETVNKWQYSQMQAFDKMEMENGIENCLKTASAAYGSEEILNDQLAKSDLLVSMMAPSSKYGVKGAAEIQRRARGKIVSGVIGTAIDNNDFVSAGKYLQGHGDLLDYKTRENYEKIIHSRQYNASQLNSFENLFATYGKDIDGAIKHLGQVAPVNNAAGVQFAAGEIGKKYGENTCALWVSKVMDAAGADSSLKSPLADGMYRLSEQRGLTFTDRSQLRDGDIVYWYTGGGFTPSDNPDDVNSSSKAYKGITHVGVYNAKTGMAVQSGSDGVREVPLDYRKVVGYSHMGGRNMDAVEREKTINSYRAYANNKIAQERQQTNYAVETTLDRMLALHNQGVTDPKQYEDIVKTVAGNDYKMYTALAPAAKAFGAGNKGKLSAAEEIELEEAINSGGVPQDQLVKQLTDRGVNTETVMKYYHMNQKALKGEGASSFKWDGMMDSFRERMGGKKEVTPEQEMGIKIYAQRYVNNYFAENKALPSRDMVLDVMVDGMVKGSGNVKTPGAHWWNSSRQYNQAELANHNIYKIEDAGNNVKVWFFGESKYREVSKENFARLMS